jgi:hypothetical protein
MVGKSGIMEIGSKASGNESVGRVRAMDGDSGTEGSSIRMVLQAMLKETTNHLISKQ